MLISTSHPLSHIFEIKNSYHDFLMTFGRLWVAFSMKSLMGHHGHWGRGAPVANSFWPIPYKKNRGLVMFWSQFILEPREASGLHRGLWYSAPYSDSSIKKVKTKCSMNHDTTYNAYVFQLFLGIRCTNNHDAFLKKKGFPKIRIMMTFHVFFVFSGGGSQKKRHD